MVPYQAGSLAALQIGGIMLDGKLLPNAPVNLLLKSFNRHGLIAGATGTGKTKTIQALCEQLSLAGVPSFVMDIKGDISGLAMPGDTGATFLARCQSLNVSSEVCSFPVEFLTLNDNNPGVALRTTVTDFGALLFARMLDVNEMQAGVITVIFEYAKESQIPLIDLADFKALLQYLQTGAGKQEIESRYGRVSASSISVIMRHIIELEVQGGDEFFGKPAFNVMDLISTNPQGEGVISILRLVDMQETPKLFSTFMLKLLSDLYRLMPEAGDPPKPKLVLFIDEAHLIFNHASKALLNLLETMVKLIRSKGIGLIFCTQTPNDIPDAVLSQLGLKIQHALRAFTAKDRKAMALVAQNFPPSEHYNTEQLLTSLGTGEALLSALDEKGSPTPLIQCLIRAPLSRMGPLDAREIATIMSQSHMSDRYKQPVTTSSTAANVLAAKKTSANPKDTKVPAKKSGEQSTNILTALSKNTLFRQIFRQLFRDLTQLVLKAMGIKRR